MPIRDETQKKFVFDPSGPDEAIRGAYIINGVAYITLGGIANGAGSDKLVARVLVVSDASVMRRMIGDLTQIADAMDQSFTASALDLPVRR